MTDDELRDTLDGLFAYDMGSIQSGIHDEALRQRCISELKARAEADPQWISRLCRDMWLSDEALAQGYRIGDLIEFVRWLSDRMDFDV